MTIDGMSLLVRDANFYMYEFWIELQSNFVTLF